MQRRARLSTRRAAALMVVALATLGLTGCFKISQTVKVRADGTGTVALHGEVNKKALAALVNGIGGTQRGPSPVPATPFRLVDRTFPDGTRVHTTDTADRSVFDASFAFNGPDDYVHKMGEIEQATSTELGSGSGSGNGSLLVRRAGDQMDMKLDPGTTIGIGDAELSTMRDVLAPDAQPSATVTVTMPGPIVASNGTARGRTVSWDLLNKGAPTPLTVTSKVAAAGLPSWALPVGAGVAALVLVLALVGLLLSRRRRGADAGPPAVPYQPGPAAGVGPTGTFFPGPGGLPPREPVGPASGGSGSPWAPEAAEPWSAGAAALPEAPPPPPPLPPPWETMVAAPPPPLVHPVAEDVTRATGDAATPPPAPEPVRPEPDPPRLSVWGPRPPVAPLSPAPVPPIPVPERVAPESRPAEEPRPTAESVPEASPWRMPGGAEEPVSRAAEPSPEVSPWRMPGGAEDPVPPVPAPPAAAPLPLAGWYADPAGGGGIRYWDGTAWTQHTR